MPELPEVETIKLDLEKLILNKTITKTKVLLNKAFINPKKVDVHGKICNIDRIGKYLIIDIENQCSLIIHLRMTGKLTYDKKYGVDPEYCRVIMFLDAKDALIFHDIRTLGMIEVVGYKKAKERLKKIGVDALSKDFAIDYLIDICSKRKVNIKTLLLDQFAISGIGNIYATEILFESKVSPLRVVNTLKPAEIKLIYQNINKILTLAIKHNGTTVSDYRRVDDKTGDFQNFLKIYGKETCPVCKKELVKIKIGGRGTRYCSVCQK